MNITASAHFCTHEDGLHHVFVGGVSEPKPMCGVNAGRLHRQKQIGRKAMRLRRRPMLP
jgi:hypothetical protein